MKLMIFLIIVTIFGCLSQPNNFNLGQPLLPRPDTEMAVAYMNHSIYILGGWVNTKQLTKYDIIKRTLNNSTINFAVAGYGNNYHTQIDNMLYWLPSDGYIRKYNFLNSHGFSKIVTSTDQSFSCLTSHNNLLYITGGGKSNLDLKATVQIYNITSDTFISDIASLLTPRGFHQCIIDPIRSQLWIIAGLSSGLSAALASVETISIDDIQHQSWQYSQNIKQKVYDMTASFYENNNSILVMGGWDGSIDRDELQMIDCITGDTSIIGHLAYSFSNGPGILVQNVQYIFGGYHKTAPTAMWQYSTPAPSMLPTYTPQTDHGYSKYIKFIIMGIGIIALYCLMAGALTFVIKQRRQAQNVVNAAPNIYLRMHSESISRVSGMLAK